MSHNKEIFLKDYKEPDFLIKETHLFFTIHEDKISVISQLHMIKNNKEATKLSLNGESLETLSVKINSNNVEFNITENNTALEIDNISEGHFILSTEVNIDPYKNTALMGIYNTKSCICSQCEPEGFRRITWYLDRPDVMSVWYVSISAEDSKYETLLSNGNKIKDEIVDGMRTCYFHDICPKPSYLFAFVAGNFDFVQETFVTKSNREVSLAVYVEKGKQDQAHFALESLIKSMKWDEDTYNLEYELDVFSIVAVSDFNFGAMENKSLNIFNDACVLANSKIATDADYFNIESIVAHEYFHNFTGDRITCKNWFQLTLKEGLTVYRDQKFSEDMHDKSTVRIGEVDRLKNYQFPEDASTLSHPIRPVSYIEMNNFYTSTVYDKGAEIIRMIETIIGEDNFKKGIDVYFEHFDGQAVTCEDFVWSMEQASGISLDLFKKWYVQSGTPILNISTDYNEDKKEFTIDIEQETKPTHDQKEKQNLVIPLKIALIEHEKLTHEQTVILEEKNTKLVIPVTLKPSLSVNRFFSAPILVNYKQRDEDLLNILHFETDGYSKYEAIQVLLRNYIIKWVDEKENNQEINNKELLFISSTFKSILCGYSNNVGLTSLLIKLPSITSFESHYTTNFPLESLYSVLKLLINQIATEHEDTILAIYQDLKDDEAVFSAENMAIRNLKNKCLQLLLKSNHATKYISKVVNYYNSTSNMSKRIGAMLAIKDLNIPEREAMFAAFYSEYKAYPTVLNKYFSIQASISNKNNLSRVEKLLEDEEFSYSNPNKVRALIGGFANNYIAFHNLDGSGYKFIKQNILKIDKINPSVAASLSKILVKRSMHTQERKDLINRVISEIINTPNISKGLFEILSK